MKNIKLGETGIRTSRLGFGCAGLFRVPSERGRQKLVHAAYDSGFRHFDVAPMYGLGRAEPELGRCLSSRRPNVTILTKFGIDVSPLGLAIGRCQAPVRAVMRKMDVVEGEFRKAGAGPSAGHVGGLLYRSRRLSVDDVRRSLDRSLRALQTDWVDVYAVHEPTEWSHVQHEDLISYLETEQDKGRIRTWGLAGELGSWARKSSLSTVPVLQYRSDILSGGEIVRVEGQGHVTFGSLSTALPLLHRYLRETEAGQIEWPEISNGLDLSVSSIADRLLDAALGANPGGPVLYTTTNQKRLRQAALTVQKHELEGITKTPGRLRALARDAQLFSLKDKESND